MKILLIITALWHGQPNDTVTFPMRSMEECEQEAADWRRHHGTAITAQCVEQTAKAVAAD